MPTAPATDAVTYPASHNTAIQRCRQALAIGNPRRVRAAAAHLPHIGISEAAAILLVIDQTEPDNSDQTALRRLGTLATQAGHVDLPTIARSADALNSLPQQPTAPADLARLCTPRRPSRRRRHLRHPPPRPTTPRLTKPTRSARTSYHTRARRPATRRWRYATDRRSITPAVPSLARAGHT
jgi:hypothetical protein